MIFGVEGVDPQRRAQLIELLEIDQEWRLNKVSDGQRRRVQICMGLLKPYQVRACMLTLHQGHARRSRRGWLIYMTCHMLCSASMASCCGPVEAALWCTLPSRCDLPLRAIFQCSCQSSCSRPG